MNGTPWTAEELAIVAEMYPDRSSAIVAKRLGRTVSMVYNAANKLGLKKSPLFFASKESGILRKGETRPEGVKSQFKKGQVPFNKGMRRPGFHRGRMRDTQFKKGDRTGVAAVNWKPIGTIASDSEGFIRIKLREPLAGERFGFGNTKAWALYNRHLWETHHGPIPPKHVVAFKDGNRANCVIENLELISRAELARRNQMWGRFPDDLVKAIQMNGALKRKLRNLHGQEQN